MTRQHHFSRYQQPRPCVVCKKLTTGVDGTDLCRPCHDRVSMENEHSDGWHEVPRMRAVRVLCGA